MLMSAEEIINNIKGQWVELACMRVYQVRASVRGGSVFKYVKKAPHKACAVITGHCRRHIRTNVERSSVFSVAVNTVRWTPGMRSRFRGEEKKHTGDYTNPSAWGLVTGKLLVTKATGRIRLTTDVHHSLCVKIISFHPLWSPQL